MHSRVISFFQNSEEGSLFSPYVTGNTLGPHFKAEPVDAAWGNSRCLPRERVAALRGQRPEHVLREPLDTRGGSVGARLQGMNCRPARLLRRCVLFMGQRISIEMNWAPFCVAEISHTCGRLGAGVSKRAGWTSVARRGAHATHSLTEIAGPQHIGLHCRPRTADCSPSMEKKLQYSEDGLHCAPN
jgi:hypothetical protein